MGEIADEHVDRMLEQGFNPYRARRQAVVGCKRCGKNQLIWRYGEKRIFNPDGSPHTCDSSAKDTEFTDLRGVE